MTFKILTDSTADLDETWAKEHDVEIVGLSIQIDGTHYETVGPDKLTSPQLLAEMQRVLNQRPVRSMLDSSKRFSKATLNARKISFISPFLQSCQGPTRVRLWQETWSLKTTQKL